MKIRQLRFLTLSLCTLLVPAMVVGQAVNFAQIHGRVTDSSGAALPAAQITATQILTGLVRSTQTNAEGTYALPSLPVGPYQLQVKANGFRDYLQKGLELQVAANPEINIAMQIGAVSQEIQVTSNAAMVETRDNAISTTIDNSRIMELPLNGRSLPDLIMLSGGATNPTLPSNDLLSSKNYGNGATSGYQPSQTISVGGGQENSNNYLLDGGDNNDAFSNVNSPFPFPDAVQEFSVQSNGLSARYGVHSGAVINVVTKSGTNQYHGSVFEFLRNPVVNAHHVQFTTPARGARDDTIKRNQFGGTFGGPVVKDKLQFFLGYQGTRQSATPSPTSTIVPTAAAMAGDFSTMMSAACQSNGKAKTLKSPFVGNKISPGNFNPQSLALLKFIPVSTNACGNISFTVPGIVDEDQGVTKLDWNQSQKQTIFARYFATDFRAPVPFDPANILPQGSTASQFARFQSLVLGHTFIFSPTFLNTLHVTATRLAINRGAADGTPNPQTLGINIPSPVPTGLVLGVSSGYFSAGGGSQMPGHFINNLYQIADDIDKTFGKHQVAFGFNWMKMQLNYISTFQSNGQFTFGGNLSGDNLADYMLGWPSNFTQGNPEAENWRYGYYGLYVHDNYRVRQNLTINAGVRWEPYRPSIDTAHRGSHFDYAAFLANQHSTVFPNAPAGLTYCGDAGTPCAFANDKWLQFSPRVGLVWDPTGRGNTSVRASYGLFYDSPEMYYFDRYADNSPYGSGVSFSPKISSGASLTNPYVGQGTVPQFPLPFPTPGSPNAFFPLNGVYINNPLDMRPMYAQNWNLSVERQLGNDWLFSANYLGSKTTHIWAAYEANPGVATPVPANALAGCTPGQAASTSNTNCRRTLYLANPSQGQLFSNVTSVWDGADANYHAMLLSARHRFAHNYTILTNYTWSHCISDQDFTGELTNSRPTLYPSPFNAPNFDNLAKDRGNCGFDVRHNINASVVMSSPRYSGGLAGALLSNWQFAPLITYRTGTYLTVLTGVDTALTGATTSFKDRPNQVGDPLSGSCTINGATVLVGDRNCWMNSAAFLAPGAGQFGNVRRDSISGPGAFRFDASISRKIPIRESKELQLRLESFNVLNHPVLGNPVASLNSANFGRILSQSGDGRTFQAAAKFLF